VHESASAPSGQIATLAICPRQSGDLLHMMMRLPLIAEY
jgi:hypothetical protein